MKNSKFLTLTLGAVLALGGVAVSSLVVPAKAEAQTRSAKTIVDQAIKDGILGETRAGYLAAVTGASVDTKITNAMNEINIGRKSLYTAKARDEGLPVDQVATLFGEKQLAAAKPGEKILTKEGRWVTK